MDEHSDDSEWTLRDERDHFSYIMAHLENGCIVGPIKVGISKNPRHRLKQVQATERGTIVLLSTFGFWKRSHARRVETVFHRVCKAYRIRGEWFEMEPHHAVAIMAKNLEEFTSQFLQPKDVSAEFSAWDYMGIPGKVQDIDQERFSEEHYRDVIRGVLQ
jgi:hypothetical protein